MIVRSLNAALWTVLVVAGCTTSQRASSPPAVTVAAHSDPLVPVLAAADRVRIVEAFRLADTFGDSLWPGWSAVPFAVLLVTPKQEFLFRHPHPSRDFVRVLDDLSLGGAVYSRTRVFPPTFLATFPAVSGVTTVVVGQAEQTGKTSTEWVLTLLHEHFHQLQMSAPGYWTGVDALGLARGDTTGMWMLNYPFPYDSADVQRRFQSAWSRLRAAVGGDGSNSAGGASGASAMSALRSSLDSLRAGLGADDYRYLAFQIWQEGVARYTEYAMAERAARSFAPSAKFLALPDQESFAVVAARLRRGILADSVLALGARRRVAFYSFGAAAALALDATGAAWRRNYFIAGYALDPLVR
jgi:hypothetical protein